MNKKRAIGLTTFGILVASLLWARWRPAVRFEPSQVGEGVLRIVTWNVGYFAFASNKNMRAVDVGAVAATLKKTGAQVVVLQELGTMAQAEAIAAQVGAEWRAYSVPTGHGEQVVSVLSPLAVVSEEAVLCGGRAGKGVTVVTESGERVYVLGVHLPHPGRGFAENVESVRDAIEHTRGREEKVRLVAGDWNYDFEIDMSDELEQDLLEDFGDGTLAIGETYYMRTRIDHVFHYPKELKVVPEGSGMIDLGLRFARVPGFRDHRPIVVSYELP